MSGIASAAPTIPGSVATFWSCSSEVSRAIDSSSSRSAKILAGTRMSGRAEAGISQSVSSIWCSSDVENDARVPAIVRLSQLEVMVGDGLHDRGGRRAHAGHRRLQLRVGQHELL